MRLSEFVISDKNSPESNLLTALELIRARYKNQDKAPKISTNSLINLVLNTDKNFDYQALVDANENNPAVKNLIKSFNKDFVVLRTDSEVEDEPTTTNVGDETTDQPVDTVGDMAARAAKQRGAPISQ